jgi:hypothetical protein
MDLREAWRAVATLNGRVMGGRAVEVMLACAMAGRDGRAQDWLARGIEEQKPGGGSTVAVAAAGVSDTSSNPSSNPGLELLEACEHQLCPITPPPKAVRSVPPATSANRVPVAPVADLNFTLSRTL